jgi:signal peptidase I
MQMDVEQPVKRWFRVKRLTALCREAIAVKFVSRGTVLYVIALALLLSWAYFVQADTRRVDGISMLPTLEGGDLVVIQGVPVSDVHVGDIIVYNNLCSTGGESVVHRVVNITSSGLITKGDNNHYNDVVSNIAASPIAQQCLEGKVVFVIPYVELLAYYVDQNRLPQWLNYLPSILILMIVIASLLGEDKEMDKGEGASSKPWELKLPPFLDETVSGYVISYADVTGYLFFLPFMGAMKSSLWALAFLMTFDSGLGPPVPAVFAFVWILEILDVDGDWDLLHYQERGHVPSIANRTPREWGHGLLLFESIPLQVNQLLA